MVSTSGSKLMQTEALQVLVEELLPIATVVTPNIPEAEIMSGMAVNETDDIVKIAKHISESYDCAVLIKGGHSIKDANDLLYSNGEYQWFYGNRVENTNTHGTGCTLSSAIAANLAKGFTLSESIKLAKEYISGALEAMLDLGKGSGPLCHSFDLNSRFGKKAEQ